MAPGKSDIDVTTVRAPAILKLVGELGVCVASAHESDWCARIASSSQNTVPVFCTAKRIASADAQSPDVQNAAPVQSQAITIGMVNLVWVA